MEDLARRARALHATSARGTACVCVLVGAGAAVLPVEHGTMCAEEVDATELMHRVLRLCEGAGVPSVPARSDRAVAAAAAALAETLLGRDGATRKFVTAGRGGAAGRDRVGLCQYALALDPHCADAYSTLSALLDARGASVDVNGRQMDIVALRNACTQLRLTESTAAAAVPPPSLPRAAAQPPSAAPTSPEVTRYLTAVCDSALAALSPAHRVLVPVVRRHASLPWLLATRARLACCPDGEGLPLSDDFTCLTEGLLRGAGDTASAFDALLELVRNPAPGVAARVRANATLYLALAYLALDSELSLVARLGDAAQAIKSRAVPAPPPLYYTDAQRSLGEYRDAVVSSAAYFDHAYFLVAALAEALSATPSITDVNRLLGAYRAGLWGDDPAPRVDANRDALFVALHAWAKAAPPSVAAGPPPGSSAREVWAHYSRRPEIAAVLRTLNGGRGLTAMDGDASDVAANPLPPLMSFIGLERIKQQAVAFVKQAVELKLHNLGSAKSKARLNYIFIGERAGERSPPLRRSAAAVLSPLPIRQPGDGQDDRRARVVAPPGAARASPQRGARGRGGEGAGGYGRCRHRCDGWERCGACGCKSRASEDAAGGGAAAVPRRRCKGAVGGRAVRARRVRERARKHRGLSGARRARAAPQDASHVVCARDAREPRPRGDGRGAAPVGCGGCAHACRGADGCGTRACARPGRLRC